MSKNGFLAKYGTSEDLHRLIDSGDAAKTARMTTKMSENPAFTREHLEKIFDRGSDHMIGSALKAGVHITSEDQDRFVTHENRNVVFGVLHNTFNGKHFAAALNSEYGKNPTNAEYVLGLAHRRGGLNADVIKAGLSHESEQVRETARDLARSNTKLAHLTP